MLLVRLTVAALAVFVPFASPKPLADAALCSKSAFDASYPPIKAQMDACANRTSIPLARPLTASQKKALCAVCTQLADVVMAETAVPDCAVPEQDGTTIKLLKLLQRLLRPCVGGSSASDSSTGSSGAESSSKPPPTAAPVSPRSSANGPLSPANATTPTMTTTTEDDTSMSVGVLVGIVAGVVVVLVLVAAGLLSQRRKTHHFRAESVKLETSCVRGPNNNNDDDDDDPSTGRASTSRFQFSSLTSSKQMEPRASSFRPSSSQSLSLNLWEDPVIIAARISKDKVFANALLSRGGFGEVYQGLYNRQPVAVKTLLPETRKDLVEINAFLAEVKLMASLEHERIVHFIGVAWDSLNDICAVTEFMEGGDLRGLLVQFDKTGRRRGFDNDKIRIALHVAHAMTYLHSLRPIVLHRDLKSKNIVLDTHLNAKLTDFGVSRESSYRTMTAGIGTSLWMAPEVMLGERYDDKADVFSFGVVLSELDSHAVPYSHIQRRNSTGHRIPDTALLQMVSLGRLRVQFTPEALPEMVELGNSCVALDPKQRPSASDLLYAVHAILKDHFK